MLMKICGKVENGLPYEQEVPSSIPVGAQTFSFLIQRCEVKLESYNLVGILVKNARTNVSENFNVLIIHYLAEKV